MKENVTIWSSKEKTKFDDLDTIKTHLLRNRQNVTVNILFSRLVKDQEDVRTYEVDYEYTDLNISKNGNNIGGKN